MKQALKNTILGLAIIVAVFAVSVPVARDVSAARANHHIASFAAAHRVKIPMRLRHATTSGDGSAIGMEQALIIEAFIGLAGIVGTVVVVNHRRRNHFVRN